MPRRWQRGQRGQVAPLLAVCMIGLLAMVGFSVDLGNSFLDRRAVQAAADTSADAGVQLLVNNYRYSGAAACNATAGNAPCMYSDAQIAAVIADVVQRSNAGSNHETSYAANYTDSAGNVTGTVGGGSVPSNTFGIQVVPADAHATILLGLLGNHTATERATATSVYRVLQTVSTTASDFFPYAVWYYNCSARRVVKPGDTVVFQDSSWVSDQTCGSSKWAGNSSNFKGYIRDSSMPATISQGQTIPTKGGNACGAQDSTLLHAYYVSNQVVLMAVIDAESGNGSKMSLHVAGFVALLLNGDYSCGGGTASATVQAYIPAAYFTNGTSSGGTANCSTGGTVCYEPSSIGLYR